VWLTHEHLLLLLLVLLANGAPVLTSALQHNEGRPLDRGRRLRDGYRLLGETKTLRGVAAALLVSTLAAWVLGLGWGLGLVIGACAMLGDLFSSFLKRRLGMPSSSMALGLDQIPEALFPLLASSYLVELGLAQVGLLVVLFFVLELLLSRVAFHLNLRRRPY